MPFDASMQIRLPSAAPNSSQGRRSPSRGFTETSQSTASLSDSYLSSASDTSTVCSSRDSTQDFIPSLKVPLSEIVIRPKKKRSRQHLANRRLRPIVMPTIQFGDLHIHGLGMTRSPVSPTPAIPPAPVPPTPIADGWRGTWQKFCIWAEPIARQAFTLFMFFASRLAIGLTIRL